MGDNKCERLKFPQKEYTVLMVHCHCSGAAWAQARSKYGEPKVCWDGKKGTPICMWRESERQLQESNLSDQLPRQQLPWSISKWELEVEHSSFHSQFYSI